MFESFITFLFLVLPILSLTVVIISVIVLKTQIADLEIKMLADSIKLQESLKNQIKGTIDFYLREVIKNRK